MGLPLFCIREPNGYRCQYKIWNLWLGYSHLYGLNRETLSAQPYFRLSKKILYLLQLRSGRPLHCRQHPHVTFDVYAANDDDSLFSTLSKSVQVSTFTLCIFNLSIRYSVSWIYELRES